MARIFISYRREDSEIWAARLEEALKRDFPSDQVFRDVTAIAPGADFVTALETALRETAAAVVVIGPSWLAVTDKKGNRRLEQAGDFVRQEVAACLARPEVRVFPVLVQGAEMPGEDELPAPLKPLWRRQALDLTVKHWQPDVAQLVQRLKEVPGLAKAAAPDATPAQGGPPPSPASAPVAPPVSSPARPWKRPAGIAAIAATAIGVAIAMGWMAADRTPDQPARVAVQVPAPTPGPASEPAAEATVPPRTDTRPSPAPREPTPAADTRAPPAASEPTARPAARPAQPAREPASPPSTAPRESPPPAPRVSLRGQDPFIGRYGFSDSLRELAAIVSSTSGGRVTMEVLPLGAVARPGELLDAVAKGRLDFVWVQPGQFVANDRAFSLIDSPPFGPAPAGYLRWRTDPAVAPIIDELYGRHGVRAFPCGVIWMADLWTNQPLRNAGDLRGRKIRASGGLRPEIFKRAGATYVALPGGELTAAIERGVVESVQLLDPASGVALKLHEHARALYFPGRLTPAGGLDLVVNPAKWESLDAAARRVIEQACERIARQMLAAGGDAQRAAVSQVALRGVAVEELPRDVEDALRRAWQGFAAELNADPTFRRLNATLERYATGSR